MTVVIYGAGAIGGVLGARLAAAGEDVTLIARGAHLDAIRRDGLRLDTPDGSEVFRLPAVEGPEELDLGPDDLVILTMKSNDTAAALARLRTAAPPETPIICAQNGVANERMALRLFANVYGVCVIFPATHLEPGVVEAQSTPITGLLDLGRYPSGVDETAERIAAMFKAATFESVARPDIMRWKYRKLIMNLGNAVQAVCVRDDDGTALIDRIRAEATQVFAAAGIDVVPEAEEEARRANILQVKPVRGRTRDGGSSWQSLRRRSGSIESDYLNGEIVLLGRLHGVPTPANELIRRHAVHCAIERRPPGTVPARELLNQLDRMDPDRAADAGASG